MGLLRQGTERLAGDETVNVKVALGQLGGIAALRADGVPAGNVVLVVFGVIVFANDDDGGGQLYLAGAEGCGVGAVAVVDDERNGIEGLGVGGAQTVAERGSVGRREDDPGAALQLGFGGKAVDELRECAATAQDEDVVGEVVAGKAVAIVGAAVDKDERDGGDEEGSDQHGADKDDEELEEEGQGRTQREVGTREEERHGLHPAGLAASSGKDQGRGGPEKPDEPEKEQQEKTQP